MATRNRVIFTGSVPADVHDMVTEVFGGNIPDKSRTHGHFELFPFNITNKYYNAEIDVGVNRAGTHVIDDALWDTVDGLVFVVNYADESGFEHVKQWNERMEDREPGIMILVAKYGDDAHRDTPHDKLIKKWCVEQGLEFIDWDAAKSRAAGGSAADVDSDEEVDEFARNEKYGAARIVEAFNANMWDNMVMADARGGAAGSKAVGAMLASGADVRPRRAFGGEESAVRHGDGDVNGDESDDGSTNDGGDSDDDGGYQEFADGDLPEDLIEKFISASAGAAGDDGDDFEAFSDDEDAEGGAGGNFDQMFMNIMNLKERAKNLPDNERRLLAEQVAMNFWKAIGGDDGEVEGLVGDDSGDDDGPNK
eukprot:Opistho-2@53366